MFPHQPTIPELLSLVDTTRRAIGTVGELLICRQLESLGYRVANNHDRGDLLAISPLGELCTVEVKIARRNKRGQWQFCLFKAGKTDYRHADVLILLCASRGGHIVPFVIPTRQIAVNTIVIHTWPTIYSGKYAVYRQTLRSLKLPI